MSESIPRIRGKVGQAEPGQGVDGKWFFQLEMATLYGERVGEPFGYFGPYDTEKDAQTALKEAAKLACEACGGSSDSYLDMKNGGVMRPWVEN